MPLVVEADAARIEQILDNVLDNAAKYSPQGGAIAVTLEARVPARPDVRYPHLVRAEGRCPPADIGGPVGYETYLRTIADPASINHEDMLDFDTQDFDPHVVDEATLRANLASLTRYIGRKPTVREAAEG